MTSRPGERGVVTLELIGALPFLVLALFVCLQTIALAREQDEAEYDARVIARVAALCGEAHGLVPRNLDPLLTRGAVTIEGDGEEVRVTVVLPPRAIAEVPGLAAALARAPAPRASVSMRRERCG